MQKFVTLKSRKGKLCFLFHKIPLIMRLICLFLIVNLGISFAATTNAQNTLVSLNVRNNSVSSILEAVEKQTEYSFIYDSKIVDTNWKASIDVENKNVFDVLTQLFSNSDITFTVVNKKIVLNHKEDLSILQQDGKRISGIITDQAGEPIIGANVVVKGTTNGTITDMDGKYTLYANPADILIVTYIGYDRQELAVGEKSNIDVKLSEDTQTLEEVVVVGYGTMKKKDLTGSVSQIKSDDIKKTAATSFDQAIQGKAAGVQVTQASSAPGGRVMIRVRGGNSLSSSNEPLYVVDGYPISAGSSAGGSGAAQNPLASINTADIESIEILKDASATAIYGARGANGVVLITTKRGTVSKAQVTFDAYYGVQTIAKKLDMMNAKEYALLVNEARTNDGQSAVFPNQNDLYNFPDPSSLGEGVDYQDEVFTDAPIQNYNLNVTGGNEQVRYAITGNYFGQDGIIKNSDFNRASFRSNIDVKLTDKISVAANFSSSQVWGNATSSEGDGGSTGSIVWATVVMPPTVPIYQEDGSYTLINSTPGGTPTPNPVAIANHMTDKQTISRQLGNVDFKWDIIKNLSLKVTFGTDMSSANRSVYWPKQTYTGYTSNGTASQANLRMASYLNENILNYNNSFGDHSFNATAGYTWQIFTSENFNGGSKNYSTDLYQADNLGAGTVYSPPGSGKSKSQLASYLGRLNYIYKDRYLFTVTGRADGSSKFGENNKWAFFPSFAVAWRASEEGFMDELESISNLKLRISYGKSGNQDIESYKSLASLGTMNYPFGGSLNSGVGPTNIPNPDLKWETTATTDFGFDLGLFNNRLSFVFDYYYKKTTDLLWNISTPSTSGFSSIFQNIGSLENKGVELSLGADVFTSEFKWNTQVNWSKNKNKVLEIPGYTPSIQGELSGHLKVNGSWLEPGLPVGVWNMLKYDGVFQDQAQLDAGPRSSNTDVLGDARFIDKNGDGKINYTDDRMIVGDPNPDFIFGWSNNFSYKNFDLSVYLQGSYGNDIINVQRAETNISGPWGNQRREILNRWTPTNTNTNVPRAQVTVDPLLLQSSWLIEDGSYARVKAITLGYTFNKLPFVRSLRVYATGNNLFTFTNYSGFDPEVNAKGNSNLQLGVDYNAYPSAKSFIFGVNVGF